MANSSALSLQQGENVRRVEFGKDLISRPSLHFWLMALILVAGLAVRLAALAYCGTGTIESEGAEYAKIAENLRNGVGYVGLVSAGPQVLFPPLFPLLIAAASYLTHDYEFAGRMVAMIMGVLLPLPVFGIASRLFTRRAGYVAAILVLLHPVAVYLSFSVYSEGPYATLLLSSIYLTIRALDEPSTKRWMFVGGGFALCYLVRPEAFAAFAITLSFAFVATRGSYSVKFKRASVAALVFLVIALPQVMFLYNKTGKLMLEGKSTILFSYTGSRMLAAERHPGADYVMPGGLHDVPSAAPDREGGYPERWGDKWAFYGINSQVRPTGMAMRPFVEVARDNRPNLKDSFALLKRGIRRNVPNFLPKLFSPWIGPLLPALALLGVVRRPWRGLKATRRLYVMSVTLAPVIAMFFVLWGDDRYWFIFLPLLSVWAANGVLEVAMWVKTSSAAAGWTLLSRTLPSNWIIPSLLVLAIVVSPASSVRKNFTFSDYAPPTRVDKEVGLWIGHLQNHPIRVMALSLPVSYHAGAQQHLYFPYCTGDLAVRYLDAAHVDYVVLRRGKKFTKYYDDWLTTGIPSGRAELLQLPPGEKSDDLVVYRWHWNDSGEKLQTENIAKPLRRLP